MSLIDDRVVRFCTDPGVTAVTAAAVGVTTVLEFDLDLLQKKRGKRFFRTFRILTGDYGYP